MKGAVLRAAVGTACVVACAWQPAFAVCVDPTTHISGYHVPLDIEIPSSFAIIIGKVVGEKHVGQDPDASWNFAAMIYTVHVERTLKGHVGGTVRLRTENDSGRYAMSVGESHILFLHRRRGKIDAGYWAEICGNSSELPEGDGIVEQVETRLGKAHAP